MVMMPLELMEINIRLRRLRLEKVELLDSDDKDDQERLADIEREISRLEKQAFWHRHVVKY